MKMDVCGRELLKISALFVIGGLFAGSSTYSQSVLTREARSTQAQKTWRDLQFPVNIQLGGDLAQRIMLTERRLKSHPYDLDFIVQDVARIKGNLRRFEEYEGDVSGRLLGAWSYISLLTGKRPAKLDSIAARVLQHQSPEGWFGIDQRGDNFDMWGRQNFGNGRLLVGLVKYYNLSGDQAARAAAEKLGDYFVATIPRWTTEYEEHPWKKTGKVNWASNTSNRLHFIKTHQTSVLEGLMMLYAISPKPVYLDIGRQIVELFPAFGQFHSHSYLNTLVGIAMLYQHTGESQYLELLLRDYWQEIARRGVPVDGGICEWFPSDNRTEGCSVTDWLRLNFKMWEITRQAIYIEQIERTWLNGLNFHQTSNGAFGHANLTPEGYTADYSEAWWCCLMHGLFAYAEVVEHAVAAQDDNVWFNLYAPMSFELQGRNVRVETSYPAVGKITVEPGATGSVSIHLRIPEWVERFEVRINDEVAAGEMHNGYFVMSRVWQPEEKITLRFPVGLRIEDLRGNSLLDMREPGDYLHPAYLFHGPLILGIDTHYNREFPESLMFTADGDYTLPFVPGPFATEGAHYRLPAQFNERSGTAILVPLSEQTGYSIWTDNLQNFRRNGEKPIQRVAVQTRHQIRIVRE